MENTGEEEYVAVSDVTGEKKVTSNQIQKLKTLVTGRFAVIHSGTLTIGNENRPVAIKSLKRKQPTVLMYTYAVVNAWNAANVLTR